MDIENIEQQNTEKTVEQPIGVEQIRKFNEILRTYKQGKHSVEQRTIAAENWWKLHNTAEEGKVSDIGKDGGFTARSAWLHNVISSKHADAMESYPEPNILPREEQDKEQAKMLTSILPCVMDQCEFEETYSSSCWQKFKTGTGIYKIIWDKSKNGGLGDIGIVRVNALNIYTEPGITDIQKSRYFFHAELYDNEVLREEYPDFDVQSTPNDGTITKFVHDDNIDVSDKSTVIECYYHKIIDGRNTLQYAKYVGETVLYATENDPKNMGRGLYDHCKYPYVFDTLFPVEESPYGYGYVDLCRNEQTQIDILNTALLKNSVLGATPRYFAKNNGGVNITDFMNISKPLVPCDGNLGTDSLREIPAPELNGNYISLLEHHIQTMRETSGNTETSNGIPGSSVTAASAIAILQEASGKTSKDSIRTAYRAYAKIVELCIELIRQFYSAPRKFRIAGANGADEFISYTNSGIIMTKPTEEYGVEGGMRAPVFDIKIVPQRKTAYTKVTQNELALQFFQLGFFNPQVTDQALMCIDMMDFDGKDAIINKISRMGTMQEKLIQYMEMTLMFAKSSRPDMVDGISADIMQTMSGISGGRISATLPKSKELTEESGADTTRTRNARERAQEASQPESGRVIGERE